ncbi:MAG TPA: DNA topoisomerase IV subunit A, partial [Burkholderiales bacterium]|nr:DNA topoisomerase IV subunit A [Burkholderiales bacterium]
MHTADLFADSPSPGSGGNGAGSIVLPPGPGDDDAAPLALFAERAYLTYAVSVVKGRALPEVADGLKPVQRRILYAMNEMGLTANAKPVKAARVVGDVLGKYHPHGDQSAYDALVRLAQGFTLRYPLIDGHGNFGSRDGDAPAAMRYTEARLTPLASLLLAEIDQGTVDFIPNYDGAFREPKLLPARLPMALLNGASGIAVGMATEIPPHNLREVAAAAIALIKKPNATVAELLTYIKGPDFPGGGQIISAPDDIRSAYEAGRGSVAVRARWTVEELARGQWQVVVTELPAGTSSQRVLEEIEELTNPKVKPGKKSLSQEQTQLKALILSVLDTVRDESGKENAVRLVLEPRSSRQDVGEFMRTLLAHTSLELSAPINFVAIGLDGRPRQKSVKEILSEWLKYRFETVTRRTQHRLKQVTERIHILEGRRIILLNIDKVIRVIRQAEEPKPELIAKFKLSERQAEDILEIRLRQLAKLEGIKIEQELAERGEEQSELEHLLADNAAMRRKVVKEIEADAKTYGDARRTLIEPASRATVSVAVVDEPATVVLSEKGWIRTRQGHGHDPASFGFKEGDRLHAIAECRTVDPVVLFGSNGRVYSVPVAQLPSGRGDGVPVTRLIELEPGARVVQMACGGLQQKLLIATSAGYGFTCRLGDMVGRTRAGRHFVSLS